MSAWNGWYHVTGSTYGTWLRGDPRGWRSRHHRQHVDGDYRNPPEPDAHAELYERSQESLKRPPVHLDLRQRGIAGEALVDKLLEMGVEILVASLDSSHYHILARFPDGQVRPRIGKAKKNASHILSRYGLKGTVWAKRCRPQPIRDRQHQINAYHYILDHAERDAWVWTFRDPPPPRRRTKPRRDA